ncbi:MAG: exodeoxyribonuclease VII large subunit [Clostridia bacterium]|nr:exodeoxyribonuclease VII large subunit [Clostridia bacterium]
MQDIKLTVSQLNTYLKNIIDAEVLLSNVSVYGEVTNYKLSHNNAYFEIKDESAQLSCIEFGAQSDIKNGDYIVVTGRPNYHVKLGRLSFVVNHIEPYGIGALYQKFLELKDKLEKEGLFDEKFKQPLPKYAKTIGVVSSETGAVIHDIINVARKNNPFTNILLYPVKVQGEGATEEIVKGIKYLNTLPVVDVIIVARGGGSFEDLAPFNTEEVARAVFESEKPIVSAIGHETDFSLCDFASDLRVPTPSVASEVCVFNYYDEVARINELMDSVEYKVENIISKDKNQMVSTLNNIYNRTTNIMSECKLKITNLANANYVRIKELYNSQDKRLLALSTAIEKLNPLAVLRAGYSKTYIGEKSLKTIKDARVGDTVITYLDDGKIESNITKIGE